MKKLLLTCLTLLLLLGSLSGLFADTPDADNRNIEATPPKETKYIINQEPSFLVRAEVDHENGVYLDGETMTIRVQSEEDGWIYVIYQNAENEKSLLFPNKYVSDNRIQSNQEICIPADETKDFSLECGAPFGKEYLTVIVAKKQLESIDKIVDEETLDGKFTPTEEKPNPDEPDAETVEWAAHTVGITTLPHEAKEKEAVSEPERYFFGIALDKYDDKEIPTLPACVNDLNKMKEIFISDCGVPAENATVLVNEEATYDNIRDLFYNVIPKTTKPGDTVFVYWSGHGNRIVNSDGNENHETLIAYDSGRDKKETQIIDDEFGVWVQKLEGRKLFVILDAAFSAGMGGDATKSQEDFALIASSAADEVSLSADGESVMTKMILETLNSKKGVSHIDLAKELEEKVSALVEEKGNNFSQHPFFQDGLSEPLILNP